VAGQEEMTFLIAVRFIRDSAIKNHFIQGCFVILCSSLVLKSHEFHEIFTSI